MRGLTNRSISRVEESFAKTYPVGWSIILMVILCCKRVFSPSGASVTTFGTFDAEARETAPFEDILASHEDGLTTRCHPIQTTKQNTFLSIGLPFYIAQLW